MIPSRKPLFDLTARDLMTPAVLTLPEEMRLRAAARLLSRQQVSGAPVVDREGHCVGVLSTTDFMHWAGESAATGEAVGRRHPGFPTYDALGFEWEMLEPDQLPHDEVREHMTRDPVTVSPGIRIVTMAQLMLDGHIHRLIVVNEERQPIGIVSTTDVLAAIARGEGSNT
jgi:CBS domain-containing protein